jgi:hypothetical protein
MMRNISKAGLMAAAAILMLTVPYCEKTTLDNLDVKTYVKLLKSGNFDYNNSNGLPDLPPFKPADIPELFKYANEVQIITKYPHNPISSYIGPDPRLGILILWTIESIRLNGDRPFGRFPSMSPTLRIKGSEQTADVNLAHPVAYQAYLVWWNSNIDFEQIRNKNPLENTNYLWW